MIFNIPNCIMQVNKSNNYIKKLVYEKRKIEATPEKIEDGYLINLGLDEKVLLTNKKIYPDCYKYVLKCIGNNINSLKITKWEKYFYDIEKPEDIKNTWDNNVIIKEEILKEGKIIDKGLRNPQIGALYSALSNWTVDEKNKNNIIVMPTGTGKTETMLLLMLLGKCNKILVVVPSTALKDQISNKFIKLGILREIEIVNDNVRTPIVGILNNLEDIDSVEEIIVKSNVVVTTMQLGHKIPTNLINKYFSHLFIDEAHHMSAQVWGNIANSFNNSITQFTATPFRNDGKIIKGKIIYNFPLIQAQKEGYFKHICFKPLLIFDENSKDEIIAKKAIEQLEEDLKNGYDHVIMARVESQERANEVYKIYSRLGKKYNPKYIYSNMLRKDKNDVMNKLYSKECRIIICVKMLGEGFDFPEFKIAAIHDQHKTLGITLQFIGRFTRKGNDKIGNATAISNIIDEHADQYLNMLYKENADWDKIINIASNDKVNKHIETTDYLNKFAGELLDIVPMQNIFPALSFSLYKTNEKNCKILNCIKKFKNFENITCSYNEEDNILVIIKRNIEKMDWSNSESLKELYYDMIIIRLDEEKGIIYATANTNSLPTSYVKICFKDAKLISGDNIFRSLYNINRLKINTMGLRDLVNGYISFRMYAGRNILSGISSVRKRTSIKNNIYGKGYENGEDVTLGCSIKGKVWTRKVGTIYDWKEWCENTAKKILNSQIDVNRIIEGINAPVPIKEMPASKIPVLIEINPELYIFNEKIIKFKYKNNEIDIDKLDFKIKNFIYNKKQIDFLVESDIWSVGYCLQIGNKGYKYKAEKGTEIEVITTKGSGKLSEWFKNFPPIITFDDGSKLENNLYIDINELENPLFDKNEIMIYDWSTADISIESQTEKRLPNSIQYNMIESLKKEKYDIVFDDDGKGEIADIIAIKNIDNKILIQFYHCKYSHEKKPGKRLEDIYEVCGQAQRSVYWKMRIEKMIERMIERDRNYMRRYGVSRFIVGNQELLKIYKNKFRVYEPQLEIFIVQPGISKSKISEEMLKVLGATQDWCHETYMIPLKVIGNE